MPNTITDSTNKIREKKRQFIDRENRIINAAVALLTELDIDHVTVSSIAERAGIGKGTIYKHFISKTELLLRIITDYENRLADRFRQVIIDGSTNDKGALLGTYLSVRLENPPLDRLVQTLTDKLERNSEHAAKLTEYYRVRQANIATVKTCISRLIEQGILEDAPVMYHYLAYRSLAQGAVDLLCKHSFVQEITDREQMINHICRIGSRLGYRA